MVLKPVRGSSKPVDDDNEVDVLIEPDADHTDEDILSALAEKRAKDVEVLVRGFISAKIKQSSIESIETVGQVSIKEESKMR